MRLNCPFEKYKDAWVEIPDEWTGAHVAKRDAAVKLASSVLNIPSAELRNLVVSLALTDAHGNIPGMEDPDPANWDVTITPVPIITWLGSAVLDQYNSCYVLPKAS